MLKQKFRVKVFWACVHSLLLKMHCRWAVRMFLNILNVHETKKKYLRIVYIFCGMGLQGWFSGLSLDWFLVYERTPGDCFLRILCDNCNACIWFRKTTEVFSDLSLFYSCPSLPPLQELLVLRIVFPSGFCGEVGVRDVTIYVWIF